MKRVLTLAMVLVALSFTFAPAAQAHGRRWTNCRYATQTWPFDKFSPQEIRETIRCASAHFPVDTGYALAIAYRESRYASWATNPVSKACGIFQDIPSYWPGRVAAFRRATGIHVAPSCYNGRTNVLVAIWMAHRGGWGPWAM